jgi:hypothetical protein
MPSALPIAEGGAKNAREASQGKNPGKSRLLSTEDADRGEDLNI